MSTVKGIRIKNALLGGGLTGAALEALLADPGNLGPYIEQLNLRGAVRSLTQTPQSMDAVAGSALSRAEVLRAAFAYGLVLAGVMPVGKFAAGAAGLAPEDYADMSEVAASQIAMDAVIASQVAMDTLAASQVAMDTLAASQVAMDTLAASQVAMDTLAASQVAMDALAASQVAMDALAASQVAMDAVYASPVAVAAIFGEQRYAIYGPHPSQITVTGQGVSLWADASGNGRDFTQETDASRPPYTGTLGDYTVPSFDGTADRLESTLFGALGANWVALTVYRRTAVANGAVIFGVDTQDSLGADNVAGQAQFVNNVTDQVAVVVHAENTYGLVTWSAVVPASINGMTAGSAPDFSGTNWRIGFGRLAGGDYYFQGQIAELVFFSAGFSQTDVDRVTRMLNIKYGLPL